MRRKWLLPLLANLLVWGGAAVVVALRARSVSIASADWLLLGVALGVVVLGELLEVDLRGGRVTQVSTAAIFALFVVLGTAELFTVVLAALLISFVVKGNTVGWAARFRSTSRRLGSMLVARGVYLVLVVALPPLPMHNGVLVARTLAMVAAAGLTLILDTGLSAMFIANVQRVRVFPSWLAQLRARAALHGALVSVAALMALAFDVLGPATFVLFLLPLVAARYAFKRYASIHRTYTQTIRALSKVPELAGYGIEGHCLRVADLSTAIARERGMSDDQVQEIEFAALLHDVGQISMADPAESPESVAGTREGRRVAEASAFIIGRTPYLKEVAQLVRNSASGVQEPSLDGSLELGAKILKVANDFTELTEAGGPGLSADTALRQLRNDASVIYDPGVVNALDRVLSVHRLELARSG